MTTYIVTTKSTGTELYRYSADAPAHADLDDPDLSVAEEIIFVPPPDQPPPTVQIDPAMWRIWVGSFFDRFGAYKIAILADPDPVVQAVVKDASVRRYIDLLERRAELTQAIALLQSKGHAVDPIAILDVAPTADEVWHG